MKIAIILNGISLYKKVFYTKFLPALQRHHDINVFETLSKNDAIPLASKAVETYQYNAIIAAGGDGTLHQVVNGVITGRETQGQLPAVGLIPIGSGNDFAKTAGIKKKDPDQLLSLLKIFKPISTNLGKITYTDLSGELKHRYFINVADIGMGPEVVRRVNESGRAFGSAVAYYKSIVSTFATYKPMVVKVTTKEWGWQGILRSLAVANGKYYGHGLCIAPDAIPTDDLFNIFICGNVSVLDFVRHTSTLKRGKHIRMDEISYREANELEFTSDSLCYIEGDGEILGTLPARVALIDKRVDFLM
jgi:YegS/Rv2252/BmrU family lipid kinase